MFSRLSPRAVFPCFGLLVLSMVLLSACGSSAGSNGTGDAAPSALAAAPAVIVTPATAVMPTAKTSKSAAVPTKKTSKSAGAPTAKTSKDASATASSPPSAGKKTVAPVPVAGPGTGTTAPAPSTAGTVYGISDPDLLSQSPAVQVQQLEAMKAMGVTSVRVEASWNVGQPNGPGSFTFTSLDQVIASVQQVGLSADLDIDQTPSWAAVSGAAGDEWAQPASASAFGTWAGAVAARYAGSGAVAAYEIWNEPNNGAFWVPAPDPAAYTADLEAAYTAIKSADPSAVVITGGLAPEVNSATSYNALTFLEDMYADGAKGSFDGVGYHPYSYPATPDEFESWSGWSQMADTSPSVRSIMNSNGDSAKQIWITEYGAPTSGPNSVGDTGQSNALVQAISLVKGLSWVGSFYIYTWADLSALSSDEDGFGLLTDGNAQKPAYASVVAALTG